MNPKITALAEKKESKAAELFGSIQTINYEKLENTIEKMYFQGKAVTPEQKAIFRHAVERTGLDPIIGQIRPILREDYKTKEMRMAIQTSIDGSRLIAERTGVYAGSDDATYESEVDKPYRHPEKAVVTVWKFVQNQRCAFTASARWSEYCPEKESMQFMWKKMPFLMLAKCAEAQALRKAFPADLSGIYTDDEMQQAEIEKKKTVKAEIEKTVVEVFAASAEQMDEIRHLCKELQKPINEQKLAKLSSAEAEASIKVLLAKKKEVSDELEKKVMAIGQ